MGWRVLDGRLLCRNRRRESELDERDDWNSGPHLSFHIDDRLKKTMETLRIIEEVSKEFTEEQ